MSYVRLQTIHDPSTGGKPPATYGDQIDLNFEQIYNNTERIIYTQTLASSASSISTGTLPTVIGGDLLRIRFRCQHTTSTSVDIQLRFNGDTGSNYVRQYLLASDTTVAGDCVAATTSLLVGTCGNESANRWSINEVEVPAYLGSSHKQCYSKGWDPRTLATPLLIFVGGNWANTAAITSLSISVASGGFTTGSSLTVMSAPVNL